MKAHGFSEEELEVFSARSVETGTIRKRIKAEVDNFFHTGLAGLELQKKHRSKTKPGKCSSNSV